MQAISITKPLHYLLVMCSFASSLLFAASEHAVDSDLGGIFEQLKTTFHANNEVVFDFLMKTPEGRGNLLLIRSGDLIREMVLNSLCETKTIISSIFSQPQGHFSVMSGPIKSWQPNIDTNYLIRLSTGIANVENALIEWNTLSCSDQKQFESTRVHDLYLLKMVLENDDTKTNFSLLPAFLETSAKNWPPTHTKGVFHPTSGYQVVVAALAKRKINKVDEIEKSISLRIWSAGVAQEDQGLQNNNKNDIIDALINSVLANKTIKTSAITIIK